MTVAASDIRDRFARFSNWGRCVDIIAPVSSRLLQTEFNGGSYEGRERERREGRERKKGKEKIYYCVWVSCRVWVSLLPG